MQYKIGVDIGTTSTKAVLFDEKNNIKAIANEAYPTFRPTPEKSEQDPKQIYEAFRRAIKQLTAQVEPDGEVLFLSFSSAMHALMAVDEAGQPLTNMWIWSDNRAQRQIEKLKQQADWQKYYHQTGTPVHPMSPFAKLLWMQEETTLCEHAFKLIGIKEYLFYHLTGKYVIDYSIASATGLFNIHDLEWDNEILAELQISPEKLSQPVDVTTAFAFQDAQVALELGLSERTQLIIGASDGCLANLGTGANDKGEVAITIGTSGALRMTMDKPYLDPEGRTFCYYLSPGKWVVGGAVNNGGNVLEWLNNILYEEDKRIYSEMPLALKETDIGAEGLLFIPYLNGERAPLWDGTARGTFHGLSAFHGKKHLIRAALEGVMFNLKEVLNILEEIGGETLAIKASGGFLASDEWAQLAADILGYPLTVSHSLESSSLGAILLVEEDHGVLTEGKQILSRAKFVEAYAIHYKNYIRHRNALRHLELQKDTF
ncbi:gluconokinase [Jeotgalibaca sp. A122]|uniref:gluconokinase n=1 Tax=Jeotgalibaca sp. A122 TaxID=3457322 RepID=UPI003FD4DBC5